MTIAAQLSRVQIPSGVPNLRTLVYWLLLGVLVYLVLSPLALLLLSTVTSTQDQLPFESGGFTLANWISIYSDFSTYRLLLNTLVFASGSLAFGFTFAIIFGWLVVRTDLPIKPACYAIILLPMCTPGMLYAISWTLLLNPRSGVVNVYLRQILDTGDLGPLNIYSMIGLMLVEGARMVPTLFLMTSFAFRNMDPSLEEAATMAGASNATIVRKITLPLLKPALLGAFIYYFVTVIEVFEIPGIIGPNAGIEVFSTRIYWATHPEPGLPDYGVASTLAMTLVAIALTLIWLYQRVTRTSNEYAVVRGKGYQPRLIELGYKKWFGLSIVWLYFLIMVFLPFLVLVWASLQPFFSVPTLERLAHLSFEAYSNVWSHAQFLPALRNTLFIAIMAATITMAIVMVSSWFVVRSTYKSRVWMDHLTFLPQAIPAIIIGLALMMVYLIVPIPIYGTVWIIVIGFVTTYLAFGSRMMTAAINQVHSELEEAAQMAGAGSPAILGRIVVPLLLPALINGWIWIAIHAMRELSISLMLYSPSSIMLSTLLWSFWQNGQIAESASLGVILTSVVGLLMLLGIGVSSLFRRIQRTD